MFTGIVEEVGAVTDLAEHGDSVRLTVRGAVIADGVGHGDSISVNGCCLTVVELTGDVFTADVMRESLARTSLGVLRAGDPVNLERAMRADARFGGHIVQGHVDATGTILERTPGDHWELVRIGLPAEAARYVVAQGSIAVDGTSLTVVEVEDGGPSFTVSLIPETLRATTLGVRRVGDPVNLEVDVLAKYVERLLDSRQAV